MVKHYVGLIKDLGNLFAPKLKFDSHINNIINRENNKLSFIYRNCLNSNV